MSQTRKGNRKRRRWPALALLVALTACVVVVVRPCCSNFQVGWQSAATAPAPKADLLEGRWQGVWVSKGLKMRGTLRSLIRKLPDGSYEARFNSTYARILTHESTVILTAEDRGDRWTFRGQADLGVLSGGVYEYEGYVTEAEYFSTYKASGGDYGEFRMTRAAATQPATRETSTKTSRPPSLSLSRARVRPGDSRDVGLLPLLPHASDHPQPAQGQQ